MADYHFHTEGDRTVGGYLYNGAVGFVTNAGGSYLASGVGSHFYSAGSRLTSRTLPVSPTARHAFEQNVGGFVMENVGDRLSGAAATTVNSFVVAPGEFDLSTAIRSGTHGFLYGGSGPTQGLRVGN
ncbi:MAG TPA: hypothetical protein K8V32_03760 [Enteractinococcus helveticum]|uniref:Uncharacterized protein n=1 Tax=Enteractinococcus helveticum TaxID=1837282 RepID=A0A921FLZ6_9MICC|nr:hypothetical protein [Enteractinococcus helveticum]HJF13906.1 hypothetical protein [Enteractinococcus helveticum]